MIKEIKSFLFSKMNLDTAPSYIKANEHRKVWNSMLSVTRDSGFGYLIKVSGTTNVFTLAVNSYFTMPAGTFTCIGVCEDVQHKNLIYFLCDTTGTNHSILRMFTENGKLEWVAMARSVLNFQPKYYVTGNVIENILKFNDEYEGTPFVDFNPPRNLNLIQAIGYENPYSAVITYQRDMVVGVNGRCYKAIQDSFIGIPVSNSTYWQDMNLQVYLSLTTQILDAIKYPPKAKPDMYYSTDLNVSTNKLRDNLWQSKYQYIYTDNEKSVWSDTSDIPYPSVSELLNGTYDGLPQSDNALDITIDTGTEQVKIINIAVRIGNTGQWVQVHKIHKYNEDGNSIVNSNISYLYRFYNNDVGEPLDQELLARPYDAVPQIAGSQEVIEKTRVAYAKYTEGYDNIDIDVSLGLLQDNPVVVSGQFIEFEFDDPITHAHQYPMYGLPIKWNDASVHTGYPQSPQQYYCLVVDFINVQVLDGYIYTLNISAQFNSSGNLVPWVYTNSSDPAVEKYPQEFIGDQTIAFATVKATASDTKETIINKLCSNLRSCAINSNFSLLAFVRRQSGVWHNDIWGDWTEQGNGSGLNKLRYNTELGVVLGFGGIIGVDFSNCIATLSVSSTTRYNTFISGDTKKLALVYRDRGKRRGSGNISPESQIYVPFQNENAAGNHISRTQITWEINHTPPMFADTYRWALAYNPFYNVYCPLIDIDDSPQINLLPNIITMTGNYIGLTVVNSLYVTSQNFPKFNVRSYEWQKGDKLRFVFRAEGVNNHTNQVQSFVGLDYMDYEIQAVVPTKSLYEVADDGTTKILDNNGNWVRDLSGNKLIINSFDYRTAFGIPVGVDPEQWFKDHNVIVQIYRLNKNNQTPLYFEFGECLDILNPHTANRMHQGGKQLGVSPLLQQDQTATLPAKGLFNQGDAYIFARFMVNNSFSLLFPCESNSFSDWYDSESISIGLPIEVNENARRTVYISNIIPGGKYITNTNVNELSKFDSSDGFDVPIRFGAINSIKEVGYTLKILQDNKPSSIYIGRAGITQPSTGSNDILSSKDTVLGTLITPNSNFGTIHPTSVARYEDNLFYYDALSGAIIRDAGNGAQSISKEYNIDSEIKSKTAIFQSHGWSNIDVFACYDQYNDTCWFTFIDHVDNSQSFTIAFHNSTMQAEEGFTSFFEFQPEFMGAFKNTFTSWFDGSLWLHNSGIRGLVYGEYLTPKVTTIFNTNPVAVKLARTLAIRSNGLWKADEVGDIFVPANNQYPRGQVSCVKSWEVLQGVQRASIGRNMTTHQSAATPNDFVSGDEIRSEFVEATIHNDEDSNEGLVLFDMEVGWLESKPS